MIEIVTDYEIWFRDWLWYASLWEERFVGFFSQVIYIIIESSGAFNPVTLQGAWD